MLQGMIESAMRRPTQRDDPEARQAGQAWAMERLDQAMADTANRQPQASQEQQTRRRWMGNWVASGQGEGYREPGMMFGSQPPRPSPRQMDDTQLRETLKGHFQNIANRRHDGNLSQALSASNLTQAVGSMRSMQSLPEGGLDFRTPDRPAGGGSTRWGSSPAGGPLGSGLLSQAMGQSNHQ